MDKSADACDNFYQYANGSWLKATEIPAAFPTWGYLGEETGTHGSCLSSST